MKYKMIAFDMDGTLLNHDKQITSKTVSAIQKAIEDGLMVVVCTGRTLVEVRDYLPLLKGVRYLICVAGGYVYDLEKKDYLYSSHMPKAYVERLLAAAKQVDCMVHLQNDQLIMEERDLHKLNDYHASQFQQLFETTGTFVDDIHAYYSTYEPKVMKLNIYHTCLSDRDKTEGLLKDLELEFFHAEGASLECSLKGITKAVGLTKLCDQLDMRLSEIAVVGDSDNDIAGLKVAGLAFAMGNASDSVKALCDYVVADCDHDGCAEAIDIVFELR